MFIVCAELFVLVVPQNKLSEESLGQSQATQTDKSYGHHSIDIQSTIDAGMDLSKPYRMVLQLHQEQDRA
jgi:hypothetical protein